jgi:hypothetical protein
MKCIVSLFICLLLSFTSFAQKAVPIAKTAVKPYSSLIAILVVGHTEGQTENAILSMNKIAAFFNEKGVKTYLFYDKAAKWSEIKEAAKGANFFIYTGHGSPGGGINIETGGTTSDILELQLSKNALVGFQSVCFGAGSSASDDKEISINEAAKRVNWYSEPFIKAGAGCYYANNWEDGVLLFLSRLFNGETLDYSKADTLMEYGNRNGKKMGILSNNFGGTVTRTSYKNGVKTVKTIQSHKSFDVAWVCKPGFSIKDLAN